MPTAAEINVGLEALADRTAYLNAAHVSAVADDLAIRARNWPERASMADGALNTAIGLAWAPDLGAAIGGGMFVAALTTTKVWTSEDGRDWTDRGAQASASFTNPSVAYGKFGGVSGFLLCNNANPTVYYTSTDGVTWSSVGVVAIPAPTSRSFSIGVPSRKAPVPEDSTDTR